MKIAYLILAHNNPLQLDRLVRSLNSSRCSFFIHIDRKSDINLFSKTKGDNIFFSKERIPVYWAQFSIVEATLIVLRQALLHLQSFDYFVLLSGSDYPLQHFSYIEDFLETNRGKEFMNMAPMPCEDNKKSMERLLNHIYRTEELNFSKLIKIGLVKIGAASPKRDYRPFLKGLVPYAGNQWWALSREVCEYILEFVEKERSMVRFFMNTIVPDEMFFHTILGNSKYHAKVQRNLTYEDWSAGGNHPCLIAQKHIDFFSSHLSIMDDSYYGRGEVLFARKFSDDRGGILAALDRSIRTKKAEHDENRLFDTNA